MSTRRRAAKKSSIKNPTQITYLCFTNSFASGKRAQLARSLTKQRQHGLLSGFNSTHSVFIQRAMLISVRLWVKNKKIKKKGSNRSAWCLEGSCINIPSEHTYICFGGPFIESLARLAAVEAESWGTETAHPPQHNNAFQADNSHPHALLYVWRWRSCSCWVVGFTQKPICHTIDELVPLFVEQLGTKLQAPPKQSTNWRDGGRSTVWYPDSRLASPSPECNVIKSVYAFKWL